MTMGDDVLTVVLLLMLGALSEGEVDHEQTPTQRMFQPDDQHSTYSTFARRLGR